MTTPTRPDVENVVRCTDVIAGNCSAMVACDDGEYVKFSDYDQLATYARQLESDKKEILESITRLFNKLSNYLEEKK